MRKRYGVLSLVGLCLAVVTVLAWIDTEPPTQAPSTRVAASPAPSSPAPTAPTAPPETGKTRPEVMADRIRDWERSATSLGFALLRAAGVGLGAYLFWRIVRLALLRPPQLVIADFRNGSGDPTLDSVLVGLSVVLRERLIKDMERVRDAIAENIARIGPAEYCPPRKNPLPQGATDDALKHLIESLKDVAPTQVKPVAQLLDLAFPPTGIQVGGILQRRGDAPGTLGISFEIASLSGSEPTPHTVWEERASRGREAVGKPPLPVVCGAPPPPSENRAWVFVELGGHLHKAHRYGDAIAYLQEALRLNPSSSAAKRAHAASLVKSQTQQRFAAAFVTGETLRDAGLIDLAITSFRASVPLRDQADTTAAWATALTGQMSGQATAYLTLARIYGHDTVCLEEQSVALYRAAVERGEANAIPELEQVLATAAAHLTHAGRLLFGLARYPAAEAYLTAALDQAPRAVDAAEILTAVKQAQPPHENQTARAAFAIGQTYANAKVLTPAKTHYEDALKAQPDHAAARDALAAVLAAKWSLTDRYAEILRPATFLLAGELARREVLRVPTRRRLAFAARDARASFGRFVQRRVRNAAPATTVREPTARDRYQGQVHNFFGALYYAAALSYTAYSASFQVQAEREYERASAFLPDWYQPHENLAELYGYAGRHGKPHRKAVQLRKALKHYDAALGRVEHLPPGEDFAGIRRLIRIGKATSLLMVDDGGVSAKLSEDEIRVLVRDWTSTTETDWRFLYALAIWHAVAVAMFPKHEHTQGRIKQARQYLAFSLARSDDYRAWVFDDQDLKGIRDQPGMRQRLIAFVVEIEREDLLRRDWCKAGSGGCAAEVDQIRSRVGWI